MDPAEQPTSVKLSQFSLQVYYQVKFREYVNLPGEYGSGWHVYFHASPEELTWKDLPCHTRWSNEWCKHRDCKSSEEAWTVGKET